MNDIGCIDFELAFKLSMIVLFNKFELQFIGQFDINTSSCLILSKVLYLHRQ
jgi:hypothetical protein